MNGEVEYTSEENYKEEASEYSSRDINEDVSVETNIDLLEQPLEDELNVISGKRKQTEDLDDDDDDPQKYRVLDSEQTKLVASHYNALEEKGLEERSKSRIFYMRNFNNWVKSMLIQEFLTKITENSKLGAPLRVLDMCCGKGGDLFKWQKGNIKHLICTDIADVSLDQCESRYKTIMERADNDSRHNRGPPQKFTAEFFACDSTRERLRERYRDPSIQLNLVSCQFAFHYCFESIQQAECMLRNAAECLLPGGYFIGTIPDANEIMKRHREAKCDTFGNVVYRISFQCDTAEVPLFGAKYDFHLDGVVDCPEFLVHFPTLVKLARRFGLELEKKESFAEMYSRSLKRGRGLIEKMQALETFPPFTYNDLSGEKEDYEHVERYLQKGNRDRAGRYNKVGTLSKSEWEAINLYTTFAFRKGKTIWNAEGKPEYQFSD